MIEEATEPAPSLIDQIYQHAVSVQMERDYTDPATLETYKSAIEHLEALERDNDLNSAFDFNSHMLFNRLIQVINCKLESLLSLDRELDSTCA